MKRGRTWYMLIAFMTLQAAQSHQRCAAQESGNLGFIALPTFFYMPETGIGGGGMVLVTKPLPTREDGPKLTDSLMAGGSYTQNGQLSGWTSMEAFVGRSRARLGLDATISRYPSRFFGVGPSASVDEAYVPFMGSAAASLGFRLSPAFCAGPRLRFAASKTLELESGGLLAKAGMTGSGGYVSNGLGFTVTFDSRDSSITPTKGSYLDLAIMAAPSMIGSSQDFGLACLDARAYIAAFSPWNSVLALQARTEVAFGNPPFQELPRIGGDKLMRGYYDGRYRDTCSAMIQAELRLPIGWRFGLALFGGLAQVAPAPVAFDLDDPKISGGIGFRVRLDDATKANMRVDIAWADGNPQFYFNFGEAF
jgi:outer membrane protein assembly factor BamA